MCIRIWLLRANGRVESRPARFVRTATSIELFDTAHRETNMGQILINLVAGALGGVGAGKSSPTFDLGMIGNIIAGAVGGGLLGQIITLLLPSIVAAAQAGNLSVGGVISQAIAGGAGGAIVTAIIGAIKNKAAA